MAKPINVVDCWFVDENEYMLAMKQNRPFCEYINPFNYFSRVRIIDSKTIEGSIGHADASEDFHRSINSRYTYFADYLARKRVHLTFDKVTLYRVVTIFQSTPLLFVLEQETKSYNSIDMVNHEDIYQLLFKEKWQDIINILHKNKTDIESQPILKHAAKTFEREFVKKLNDYPLDNREVKHMLGLLYALHHGKFYQLSDDHLKIITMDLARRSPIKEAYNFAELYPEENESKKIINEYKKQMAKETNAGSNYNWIEIFNRLFEAINNQADSDTYFSGPRFMTLVKEFLPYNADYSQYIQLRNEQGKSTSRKIFYYDVLMEIDEPTRIKIVERILSIIERSLPEKANAIATLLGKSAPQPPKINEPISTETFLESPTVFISYSWDSDEHKKWVYNLAEKLAEKGIRVILDQYSLRLGKSLPHFVEQSISKSDKILIIFTPNYRLKADGRSGGVGYEYSIMNANLYQNQTGNEKIIPILRNGTMQDSIPSFMQQFIHLNLSKDDNFETGFNDLIREIYNEPAIKVPALGKRPEF
jgi:hypothetical protein